MKVLHFDDEMIRDETGEYPFSDELKSILDTEFVSHDFTFESWPIRSRDDMERLKERLGVVGTPENDLDLVLIDLRLDLSPSLVYRDLRKLEGLEIARLLHENDPSGVNPKRACLTRTVHRGAIETLKTEHKGYDIDFLTKRTVIDDDDDDGWAIKEPFPDNLITYIGRLGKARGNL